MVPHHEPECMPLPAPSFLPSQDFGLCRMLEPEQTHISNFKKGCAMG